MRKLALAAALVATALTGATALADASGPTAGAAAATRVKVGDNYFKARTASVRRGRTVTWVWRGDSPHNVVFGKRPRGARKPRGCRIQTNGKCVRRFRSKRGTYSYRCTLHGSMTGKIRVR